MPIFHLLTGHGKKDDTNGLCLPADYASASPIYDRKTLQARRISAFDFAAYLIKDSKLQYIIDVGCSFAEESKVVLPAVGYIGLGDGINLQAVGIKRPDASLICTDLTKEFVIDENILRHSIVVCDTTLGRLADPRPLLRSLSNIAKTAPYVLIATLDRDRVRGVAHRGPPPEAGTIREWNSNEFRLLLKQYDIDTTLMGYVPSDGRLAGKMTAMTLAGTHASYKAAPPKKVLAIVSSFNDEDIIVEVIQKLIDEGVYVWAVDNWSNDLTYKYLEAIKKHYPDQVVCIERYPKDGPEHDYRWQSILRRKEEIALASGDSFDWFIAADSDEMRESPWPGVTLSEAISFVDALGFNAINHLSIDFRPTRDGFDEDHKPLEFFTHFEYNTITSAYVQKRAWAFQSRGVDLTESGGHEAKFAGQYVFPIRFLTCHFSLRSSKQAYEKIYKHRIPRFDKEEKNMGWHMHYDHYNRNDPKKFLWQTDQLIPYHKAWFHSEFFLERLAALNLRNPLVPRSFDKFEREGQQPSAP